jgi:hypothetical protein
MERVFYRPKRRFTRSFWGEMKDILPLPRSRSDNSHHEILILLSILEKGSAIPIQTPHNNPRETQNSQRGILKGSICIPANVSSVIANEINRTTVDAMLMGANAAIVGMMMLLSSILSQKAP